MTPHLSPFAESDRLLFISGQLPFDSSRQISSSEIEGQTRQVLANMAAVLDAERLSLTDIVKTTVWLKNAADFPGFDAVYAESFGDHRPARSTVVCDLVLPTALIEIEAIAQRRSATAD